MMVGGAAARRSGCDQRPGGFYDGNRFGKDSRGEVGVKNHHRHGQIENPVSIYLHGNDERTHPDSSADGRKLVKALAEAVHYFKNNQAQSIKIMAKYTRGQNPAVLEGSWVAYKDLLVEDTYPTLEGLNDTLAVQANWDPKAARAKAKDFVDLRFVDQLSESGFLDKLYGRSHMSRN